MATSDKVFAGSIPEIYDRYLVPLIFESYAEDLARRLNKIGPRDVLEIAAGTGVLTRAMASELPVNVQITATDLNQPMIDFAAAKQPPGRQIAWKAADALSLPYPDESFDAVVCQFGVMFFPDKVKGFKEVLRVLKVGGTFAFNVWDRVSENEFIEIVNQTLENRFPNDPPRFMARVPHGYCDPLRIKRDLLLAGFENYSIEVMPSVSKAPSARHAAIGYCQGNPLRNEIEARAPSGLEVVTGQVEQALAQRFGTGPIHGRLQALVIAAQRT